MAENNKKPNIVLILTDHFRRDALGKSTPNLLKLAADGVMFSNAYCTAPLCQPSRISMMTGLLPSQTGICGNSSPPIYDEMRDKCFTNILKENGYRNAMIGKHHFIDNYALCRDITQDDEIIKQYGFDHVVQVVDDGENNHNEDAYTHYLREQKEGLVEELRKYNISANHGDNIFKHALGEEHTADYFIAKSGYDYVEQFNFDEPMYLHWSFIGPHPPLWHPGDLEHDPENMIPPIGIENSDNCKLRRAHYMDKVALLDKYIGKMIDLFKSKGQYENTIFIFTADHGDNLGDFGIWDKRFFYENCAGIPFIVAGKGMPHGDPINGIKICKSLISGLDIYPSVLNWAGVENYDKEKRIGLDLLPVMEDVVGSSHKEVFSELGTCCMVRIAGWKLVYDPQQGGVLQLFNLVTDPKELTNLAGNPAYNEISIKLVSKLLDCKISQTQYTHQREKNRLQSVHII